MKLLELIVKLQEIEKNRPGMEVPFQRAENHGNGFTTSPLILLDIRAENRQGHCLITLGDLERDVEAYKEYLEIRAQRSIR